MSVPPEVVSGSTLTLPRGDPPSSSAAASWTFCESNQQLFRTERGERAAARHPRHLVRRGRATDDRTGLVRVHESRRDHIDHDGNRDEDAQEQPAPPPKGVQNRTQIRLRPRRPFHAAAIIRSIYRLSRTWSQAAIRRSSLYSRSANARPPLPARSRAPGSSISRPRTSTHCASDAQCRSWPAASHGPHVGRRRRGHDRHPHPPEADQLGLGLAALQRAVERKRDHREVARRGDHRDQLLAPLGDAHAMEMT